MIIQTYGCTPASGPLHLLFSLVPGLFLRRLHRSGLASFRTLLRFPETFPDHPGKVAALLQLRSSSFQSLLCLFSLLSVPFRQGTSSSEQARCLFLGNCFSSGSRTVPGTQKGPREPDKANEWEREQGAGTSLGGDRFQGRY